MFVRWFSAVLLFLLLIAGCGRPGERQAEVSGQVTYQGKPLPGGRIIFVSPNGYTGTSIISAQGEYRLKAPIGEVRIGVENQMLNQNDPERKKRNAFRDKGRLRIPDKLAEKQPLAGANLVITGTYVGIPKRYADPSISGLTYTVTSGSQTHDIELSDNPGAAPGR